MNLKQAEEWKKCFQQNSVLMHLDISQNNLASSEVELMSKFVLSPPGDGLKDNHAILGIHMVGNQGKTDALGFVSAQDEANHSQMHLFSRIKRKLFVL